MDQDSSQQNASNESFNEVFNDAPDLEKLVNLFLFEPLPSKFTPRVYWKMVQPDGPDPSPDVEDGPAAKPKTAALEGDSRECPEEGVEYSVEDAHKGLNVVVPSRSLRCQSLGGFRKSREHASTENSNDKLLEPHYRVHGHLEVPLAAQMLREGRQHEDHIEFVGRGHKALLPHAAADIQVPQIAALSLNGALE
ncbi:GL15662 [Drosophila persimilis]|uniref:GL15662 n=1 Tax=Drosophila persimilis TaxID=7234 RepID=B4GQ30_DROPE|nr:GL15662 [Drosophila persimilis]